MVSFVRNKYGYPRYLCHKLKRKWNILFFRFGDRRFTSGLNGEIKGPVRCGRIETGNHLLTRIGAYTRFPAFFFKGKISEIIIYNRALSDEELETVYSFLNDKYFGDHTPPAAVSAVSTGDGTEISVCFNEKVTSDTAENISNYTIDGGISITNAKLSGNNQKVVLTVSPCLSGNTNRTLTVSGISDINGNIMGTQELNVISADIPSNGLSVWYAADGAVDKNSSGKVKTWYDLSGNFSDLIQKCIKYRPELQENIINGNPALIFDGRDFLKCRKIKEFNTDKFSWFIVFKTNKPLKFQNLLRNAYRCGARWNSRRLWGSFIFNNKLYGHARDRRGRLKAAKHDIDTEWHMQSVIWG